MKGRNEKGASTAHTPLLLFTYKSLIKGFQFHILLFLSVPKYQKMVQLKLFGVEQVRLPFHFVLSSDTIHYLTLHYSKHVPSFIFL